MSEYLVMTAIGPDRPGIVEQLSHYIVQSDGNVEDSRMAVLGGEFAAVLLVSGRDDAMSRIHKNLGVLQQDAGLTVAAKPTQTPPPRTNAGSSPTPRSRFHSTTKGWYTRSRMFSPPPVLTSNRWKLPSSRRR